MKMKKLLLIETSYFGYEAFIKKAFEDKGFSVDLVDDRPSRNTLVKGLIRINPSLMKRRIHRYFYQSIFPKALAQKYDYVVVILGQSFSSRMFLDLKKAMPATRFILYFWDSVANFPQFEELSNGFDVTYSFDRGDCEKYGFKFLPLFYSDAIARIASRPPLEETKYDVSYVGTIKKGKLLYLEDLKAQLSKKFDRSVFFFYLQSKLVFLFNKFTNPEFRGKKCREFSYQSLTYQENIDLILKSRFVIDVPMANQNGLSMRTFETLAMKRKLITTNASIKTYDFYNPKNIYVFDGVIDFDDVFFNSDFDSSCDSAFAQYSIEKWADRLIQ